MRGGSRPGAGRPRKPKPSPIERTPAERVAILAAVGTPARDIAHDLGMTVSTLRERFGRELRDGPALATAQVMTALRECAAAGGKGALRELARIERRGLRTAAKLP